MLTIHKYKIHASGDPNRIIRVEMPEQARILSVQQQQHEQYPLIDDNRDLTIWAMVDTNNNLVKRKFRIIGTGQEIEDENHIRYGYCGTVVTSTYVWHVFESR